MRGAHWKRIYTVWVARVDDAKRAILTEALASHDGNRTATARELGLERSHVQRLIRELLQPDQRRRTP